MGADLSILNRWAIGKAAGRALLQNHHAFLAYLTGWVGDPALAEDILQDGFGRDSIWWTD